MATIVNVLRLQIAGVVLASVLAGAVPAMAQTAGAPPDNAVGAMDAENLGRTYGYQAGIAAGVGEVRFGAAYDPALAKPDLAALPAMPPFLKDMLGPKAITAAAWDAFQAGVARGWEEGIVEGRRRASRT